MTKLMGAEQYQLTVKGAKVVDQLLNEIARAVAEKMRRDAPRARVAQVLSKNGVQHGVRRPKIKRDMRCKHIARRVVRGGGLRDTRCTNRSKGPRFHYLCDKHL